MHGIRFVADDALPEGHDFVLIQAGDDFAIFYRESTLCPAVLEESWAAYRALRASPPRFKLRSVS